MSKQPLFITVKDLMELHGTTSYEAMRRLHQNIRHCLTSEANRIAGRIKTYLTIKEYCAFEDLNEQEVTTFLNERKNKPSKV